MNNQSGRNGDVLEFGGGAGAIRRRALFGIFCGVLGALAMMAVASARAGFVRGDQDQSGAGVMLSKQATAKDVGLPVYPGAKAHKDEKDDSPTVQMGFWDGSFGFKLAVMKMPANEAVEKIAALYMKPLAKY